MPAAQQERVPFAEASYSAGFAGNPEFAPDSYRLAYSSMVTPATVYDYHPAEQRLEVRKVQEIPSGYDAGLYVTERLMVPARDGKQVPVSVLRRKDFAKDGGGKLFVYGYGAYGFAIPPSFSTSRLSLVDRGFAFAIAHIRGGDDLGYQWFLDGKLKERTNAFNDFVDVTRGLIAEGYAKAGRVAAQGGSAGGELMGAAVNQAPELYGAVVADVPFVDVLNTMLDDTLPLTPGEWTEWGNPITDADGVRADQELQPVRQCRGQALSGDADHRRPDRPARHLLGAGQMGRQAPRDQDRRQSAADEDQHGRRPWRQVGPLELAARAGRGLAFVVTQIGRTKRAIRCSGVQASSATRRPGTIASGRNSGCSSSSADRPARAGRATNH